MGFEKRKMWKYIGRLVMRILMVLGGLELLIFLAISLSAYFTGFTFFFSTTYGWEAVADTLLILGLVLSPLHAAAVLFLVGFSIYFRVTRKKYDKEEEKRYLKRIGKALILPGCILAAAALLFILVDYILYSTILGARIMVRLGQEKRLFSVREAHRFVYADEVFMVEKNGELIYLKGKMGGEDLLNVPELAFLDDLYYTQHPYTETPAENIPDMTGADRYLMMDRDGVLLGMYTVKGDDLVFSDIIGPPYDAGFGEMPRYMVRLKEK